MNDPLAPLVFVASLSLVGCAPGLTQPNAAHVAAAQKTDPSTNLDELSRGRTAYAAKCGNCHALQQPEALPPEKWRPVVTAMQEKQGVRLTPQEEKDIVRYLEAVATVASARK